MSDVAQTDEVAIPEITEESPTQTGNLAQTGHSVDVASPEAAEFNHLWKLAAQIGQTDFVPDRLKGKQDKIFATFVQGRALGVDPMTALREVWISPEGSPELGAELQLALVRRAGHSITGEATREKATVTGKRADTGDLIVVEFTLEDAAEQGLVEIKDGQPYARSKNGRPMPWERYTAAMLWHRAVTTLVRRLFSDCLVGQ